MEANTQHSLCYLKFLSLVKALRDEPSFPKLNVVEQSLMELFGAVWHSGSKITVLEAMHISKDISPSTVHRRIKTLKEKGMIMLVNDEVDTRIKYLMPTPLTMQFFDQLGRCMEIASRVD